MCIYNNNSKIKTQLFDHRIKNFQLWWSLTLLKPRDLIRLLTLRGRRIFLSFFSCGNHPAFNGLYKLPLRLVGNHAFDLQYCRFLFHVRCVIFRGRGKELSLAVYELIWHLQKSGVGTCNITGWDNKRFSLTPVSCASCDWAGCFSWCWCDRVVVLLEIVALPINNTFFFFFMKAYTVHDHPGFFSLLIFQKK